MDALQKIIDATGAVKKGGSWVALCPAHAEKTPSFYIEAGDNGRPLVHCFGGCSQDDLIAALVKLNAWEGGHPSERRAPAPTVRSLAAQEVLKAPPMRWLIKDLLPEKGVATLIGPPNCGKSFIAQDIIWSLLDGTPFLGHKITGSGCVTYLAAEGGAGLSKRLKAAMISRPKIQWPCLRIIPQRVKISDPLQTTELIECLRSDAQIYGASCLLVIDTLNSTYIGDENSSSDMGRYLAQIDRIKTELGLTVLIIHHMGKDLSRGGRGHGSLFGEVDVELALEPQLAETDEKDRFNRPIMRETGLMRLYGRKARDSARSQEALFALREVNLGKDSDGDMITSCVVEPAGWNGGV